mgnify:CR=1 FL=1
MDDAPIVPVAILGGGEAVPTISNLYKLGKLLGAPYIPITPYLVAAPLPAKIVIRFGQPLTFSGNAEDSELRITELVDQVRERIAAMIEAGKGVAAFHDRGDELPDQARLPDPGFSLQQHRPARPQRGMEIPQNLAILPCIRKVTKGAKEVQRQVKCCRALEATHVFLDKLHCQPLASRRSLCRF